MVEKTNNKRTKEFFREWLEKLQQESWQLELLISGLALFGIWESRSLISGFRDYIDLNVTGVLGSHVNIFYLFMKISWSIFFINLLIHITVRGLWIGAIGLRYVSGDIDYEALDYSERFEKFLVKNVGDFDDYIERLEKLSSIIFSFTFLLLFFFLSIMSLFVFIAALMQIGSEVFKIEDEGIAVITSMFILLLTFLVFIDFISFGSLKRIESPIFSKFYYWIYRVVGVLTLSFLFRPLLYNFIDDKYTRRLVIIAIPYIIFISFIAPSFGFNSYTYHPSFSDRETYKDEISARSINYINYDDLREQYARQNYDEKRNPIIKSVSIDAYEYSDQALAKVFFRSNKNENETFESRFPKIVPFTKKGFYSLFNSSYRENEFIDSFRTEEVKELRFMRSVVRGEESKLTEDQKVKYGNKLEYYQSHDPSFLEALRDEIHQEYVDRRTEYYEEYLDDILAAKLSLITMKIDSVDMTDSLNCSYFIHPNMGEKGILCYFPISSYSNGRHNISIKLESANGGVDKNEARYIRKKFPFVINRKIK